MPVREFKLRLFHSGGLRLIYFLVDTASPPTVEEVMAELRLSKKGRAVDGSIRGYLKHLSDSVTCKKLKDWERPILQLPVSEEFRISLLERQVLGGRSLIVLHLFKKGKVADTPPEHANVIRARYSLVISGMPTILN